MTNSGVVSSTVIDTVFESLPSPSALLELSSVGSTAADTVSLTATNSAFRTLFSTAEQEQLVPFVELERALIGTAPDRLRSALEDALRDGASSTILGEEDDACYYNITFKKADSRSALMGVEPSASCRDSTELDVVAQVISRYMEAVQDIMYIKDTGGRYRACSVGLAEHLGLTREEIIGKTDTELEGTGGDQFSAVDETLLASGQPFRRQHDDVTLSGERRFYDTVKTPLFDGAGNSIGLLGVSRDLTALKQSEDEMNRLAIRAEAANTAKSEFIANMSHEIRTPMNGIVGMAGLLSDTELRADQRDYLDVISRSAESLLAIVNDVLDFSSLTEGKIDLELMDFELRNTVEDTVEMIAALASEKQLDVLIDIDPELPPLVHGDPGRLRQILINLGSNAVKFTPSGTVTVRCALDAKAGDQVSVRFEVEDTGIGIEEGLQEKLFAPFTQQDGSLTREYGGTGLGLTISRQLSRVMGGKLSYRSAVGNGSVFVLHVPFQIAEAPEIPTVTLDPVLSGTRILVVDDNETSCVLAHRILTGEHADVVTALGGEPALSLLHEESDAGRPFHAVVIDRRMPGMSGEELGIAIRADEHLPQPKLLMIAAVGKRGDAKNLAALGFNGYLTKPIRKDEFITSMKLLLAPSKEGDLTPRPFVTRHLTAEASRRSLRVLVAEDNYVNQMVAVKMLQQQSAQTLAVANGLEVLDALEHMPFDLVLMDLHMPEMDGLDATRRIRSANAALIDVNVPIIGMTAHSSQTDPSECIDAGMDEFVLKPLTPKTIARLIRDHVHQHRSRVKSVETPAEPKEIPSPGSFDAEKVLSRVFGDRAVARELAETFIDQVPKQMEEIHRAFCSADMATVARIGHKLKGTALALSAAELEALAAALQEAGNNDETDHSREIIDSLDREIDSLLRQVNAWSESLVH